MLLVLQFILISKISHLKNPGNKNIRIPNHPFNNGIKKNHYFQTKVDIKRENVGIAQNVTHDYINKRSISSSLIDK